MRLPWPLLAWAHVALAHNACEECAQLAKRVEQLETFLSTKADLLEMLSTAQARDSLKVLIDGKMDAGVVMTRKEVHERFELFHAAQMQTLEAALSEKADAKTAISRKEVHERFQMYHVAQMQALDDALSEKADAKAVISRQEVHERFQLFHRALENVENASRDGVSGNTTRSTAATQAAAALEVPGSTGSLLSSVLWFLAVGFAMMMAFLSLCIVLGESKVNHERLQALESRIIEEEEPPKPICDLSLLALEDIKQEKPRLRTKVLSGAVGAAIGSTTGAISGSAVGGTVGAVVGLVPAVFTFGLSIPVGAAIGSGLGFASGGVVGGSAGAVGGVKVAGRAANWIRGGGKRPSFSAESIVESLSSLQSRSLLQEVF